MNLYSIYIKTEGKKYHLVAIKQGFSFWGGFFSIFWALYYKMWLVSIILILANVSITYIHYIENLPLVEYFKDIIQIFIFGFFAEEFRELYAQKQGMKLDDIILANSEENAEFRYLTRNEVFLN